MKVEPDGVASGSLFCKQGRTFLLMNSAEQKAHKSMRSVNVAFQAFKGIVASN